MSNTNVITSEAAERYAGALLELAPNATALKTLEKDLNLFQNYLTKSADLARLVTSPVISSDNKCKALLAIAKTAKYSKLTTQFIGTVAQNQRAAEFPEIIRAFNRKLAEKRGTQSGELISATKLTSAQVNGIKTQLKKTLGQSVVLSTRVDPDLLGGFVVQVGSRYFDSSLKTKLEELTLAMKEA